MRTKQLHAGRAGATLIEVALASTLLVIVGSTAILAARSTTQAWRTETTIAELERVAREAMAELESGLQAADADSVTPPAKKAPLSSTTVSFARCTGCVGGVATFGPTERFTLEADPLDPDDGLDNDDDGTIDEGRLVWIENPGTAAERRRVLVSTVEEYPPREIAGNGLDDNANGLVDERGFSIDYDGNLATLRLAVAHRDQAGVLIEHELTRTIGLRNTGVTGVAP